MKGKARCRMHGSGGAPSGPRNGRFVSGEFTKEAVAARKLKADAARRAKARMRLVEQMAHMLYVFERLGSRHRSVNEAKLKNLKAQYEELLDPPSERP